MRALLFLLLLQPVSAAAQTRDVRANAGVGAIAGVVVSDDADAVPVRKARVMCNGPDAPGNTTITDENGRFAFLNLPTGRYTITASKPTWVTSAYGARRPMRAGTPVPVAAGQTLRLTVRLARGAVITGSIADFDNQPASGAQVRALRYQMVSGERRLVESGSANTDDRGVYRIYGLAAGDYLVSASTRNLGGITAGDLQLTGDADVPRTVALAPVFYPNGTTAAQASPISLRAGEERTGVDLALQLVRTTTIDGSVTLPEGGIPASTEVNLITTGTQTPPGSIAENLRRSFPGADGTFQFRAVPPGAYQLVARGSKPMTNTDGSAAPALMVWASTQIAVDGEPVTGVSMSLEPGLTIAGSVRFTATTAALKAPDPATVRISLLPADAPGPISFAPAPVSAGADGTFRITGVVPGRYRMTASFPGSGRPGGWLVDSIVANGGDALDAAVTVAPNQHVLDAVISFTDRLAQISGVVTAASATPSDYTVVFFPDAQQLWVPRTRRIQATRVAADGTYVLRGVPAGTYRIALSEDVETGEWFDPVFLQRLLPSSTEVVIKGREPLVLNLRGR